jgi:hypothetical protein
MSSALRRGGKPAKLSKPMTGHGRRGKGQVEVPALEAAGEYTVVVDPSEYRTGTVRLRLIEVHDQVGSIVVDGPPVPIHIGQPSAEARLTFNGTAGRRVTIELTGSTLPPQCSLLVLLSGAKHTVGNACVSGGTGSFTLTLPAAGPYTVVVNPADRATGDAVVKVVTAAG